MKSIVEFLFFPGLLFTAAAGLLVSWYDRKLTARVQMRDTYPDWMLFKAGESGLLVGLSDIVDATEFFYAETYHQQYLSKNPAGYCPNHATGVTLPEDFATTSLQCQPSTSKPPKYG